MTSAAGPQDQQTQKAAGLTTKLPVLWQWTGPYFEHCQFVEKLGRFRKLDVNEIICEVCGIDLVEDKFKFNCVCKIYCEILFTKVKILKICH